ncbi:hypothetical protein EMPG_17392 [Blastomyces silverae]|uniref:Uncharacterized protein n=1 Tax=Blastomyces silverae TaxID=2060906 RepID=A0A0H1B7Y9_9EURO|nr:hypothetical protein EMPG_17392 [Blastomyces silverae]
MRCARRPRHPRPRPEIRRGQGIHGRVRFPHHHQGCLWWRRTWYASCQGTGDPTRLLRARDLRSQVRVRQWYRLRGTLPGQTEAHRSAIAGR